MIMEALAITAQHNRLQYKHFLATRHWVWKR